SPKTEPPGSPGPAGTHLVNEYSQSKWEQEQVMWAAHREDGLPLTVVRPAPIYGPGSDYGHGGIILAIAQGFLPAIPADAKNFITTSVHVADTARLAVFLADRDDTLGEDYDAVDSSIISYHEFLHYIALLTGRKMRDVPVVPMESLRLVMMGGASAWTWLERRLRVPRVRVFEVQSTPYICSSYWLDNAKSRSTGFEYSYPDVREGLKETVAWYRERGWLTDRRRSLYVGREGSKDTPTAP
ncbi:MAG: NAD(P)-dependent oxidoreductase, partial [Myxococcota bacterium]|nr:NAD(P)-dependent oxidoreductase [Myxococcota bacterium]